MLLWNEPVSFVKGATPSVRRAWESLGIKTIEDLFLTIPRRYDDYSKITSIREALGGDNVTLKVKVEKCAKVNTFRKRFQVFKLTVTDDTGKLTTNFFNQPWVLTEFVEGREIFLSGKVKSDPRYGKTLVNPLWESTEKDTLAAGKLAPVYGLAGTLAQKTYRRLVAYALENLAQDSIGLDSADETKTFVDALRQVHAPESAEDAEEGRRALGYREMLTYQVALRLASREADEHGAPPIPFDEPFAKSFVERLPFDLTGDQKRAVWAALKDMEAKKPMRRLLQGDVGSGKTAVAAFLMAHVQHAGGSGALLAPTDILAKQHAESLRRILAGHATRLVLVTRTDKRLFYQHDEQKLDAAALMETVDQGNAIFVGTHALLEAGRLPPDLALAIVDEQHRFGVDQRETLVVAARKDGRVPHLLSMTATPIPRSLALVMYGDLDVSVIREKPAGRVPIKTFACHGAGREKAYAAMREAVERNERVFVVCPLIDPSDALGVASATDEAKRLAKGPLEGVAIGLLHGRMKAKDKDDAMQAFIEGKTPVLVSTTVIEVGVDVPNATVIAIEGAERFGLAQLHQLRGRVGRSHLPSACYLMTDTDGIPFQRLKLLETIDDGFRLAEEDLKRRGSGNLYGTQQSGELGLNIARFTDTDIISRAQSEATEIVKEDPTLEGHSWLQRQVERLRVTSHLE
jgi:ATP-dependent DNA helicase RecG